MVDEAGEVGDLAEASGSFFVIVDFVLKVGKRTPIFLLDEHKKPKPFRTAQEARTAAADAPLCHYNPYWIIDINTGEVRQ